jgi:hypothetical protein
MPSSRLTRLAAIVSMFSLLAPATVGAHGFTETMTVASAADGGGQLLVDFKFTTVGRLAFSTTVATTDVYAGTVPAFEEIEADDVDESLFTLDAGTVVTLEVTGLDTGKTAVKIGTSVLDEVGESAVLGTAPIGHTHPEWQLLLEAGDVGEGSVSFKLTTTSPAYSESKIYTVKLANGHVKPFAWDADAYDEAAVDCQRAIGKAVPKFVAKVTSSLRICLGRIAALQAKEALTTPPEKLEKARAAAERACAGEPGTAPEKTALGKIEAARVTAAETITAQCGALIDATALSDHLDTASCRAEELLAAIYPGAQEGLHGFDSQASQGGEHLEHYFPCLVATIGE